MRETKSRWAPRWLLLVSAITMTLAACGWRDRGHNHGRHYSRNHRPKRRNHHPTNRNHGPCHRYHRGGGRRGIPGGADLPGTADDLSWSNAWWDGAAQAMEANPNITVESVELNDPAAVVQQGSAFASEGFDLILIAHGDGGAGAHPRRAIPRRTSLSALQPR